MGLRMEAHAFYDYDQNLNSGVPASTSPSASIFSSPMSSPLVTMMAVAVGWPAAVTHSQEMVDQMGKRVITLNKGRLVSDERKGGSDRED